MTHFYLVGVSSPQSTSRWPTRVTTERREQEEEQLEEGTRKWEGIETSIKDLKTFFVNSSFLEDAGHFFGTSSSKA